MNRQFHRIELNSGYRKSISKIIANERSEQIILQKIKKQTSEKMLLEKWREGEGGDFRTKQGFVYINGK